MSAISQFSSFSEDTATLLARKRLTQFEELLEPRQCPAHRGADWPSNAI